jgi:hypothetical protein
MYLGLLINNESSVKDKEATQYCINSSIFGFCDPHDGFKSNRNRPNYQMGLHMMNDPGFSGLGGSTRKQKKGTYNVVINDDYLAYATRDIKFDEELFLDYNYDIH